MSLKNIVEQLNLFKQCKKYNLPLWQCPQFLFLFLGIFIIASILIIYAIGVKYINEPEVVALITLLVAIFLIVLDALITRSFERLAEASRMKSEFIKIVSHQLRTPLTNFKWTLESLLSQKENLISEKYFEYFKILKENSERMENLMKDLLVVAQIETEGFFIKKEEFSLEELTKEVIKEFECLAKKFGVEIKYYFQENLPKVLADKKQIKEVVKNLLDNAIRYNRENGKVEIKIEKKPKYLYFEIKDTGVGIPKDDQKYIFQKFFRSANIMRYQTQGTGLGLYIAKKIVEKSGGKIGFKSQENKGSTFYFTLPLSKNFRFL